MRKLGLLAVAGLLIAGTLIYNLARSQPQTVVGRLSAVAAASGSDDPRWQRVTAPRLFTFPVDHGSHPAYQTEWWYYTGNLTAGDGRPFGFQLTFFRRGLDPRPTPRASRWATRDIYLAHFAISDIQNGKFYPVERYSRDGAGLAGATGEPYRVWLGPWQAAGVGPGGMAMRLQARTGEMALDLRLNPGKPPVLQGDRGYSPKGQGRGNASYYYSLTRMATTGSLTIGDRTFTITEGQSWMDHEWGTSRLEQGATGWDWFGLQLSDGRELTWAQLRGANGLATGASFGSVTAVDGSVTPLRADDLQLEVTTYWASPRTRARYPASWRLRAPKFGIDLQVTPRVADQELPVSITYWEGAVTLVGSVKTPSGAQTRVTGSGYVELTGYLPSSGGTSLR